MYLSGARAADIASLPVEGVERIVVGDAIGLASAVKMCTASVYKGRVALLAQALRTAAAHGVVEHVLDDLAGTGLADRERTGATLAKASAKAWRYVAEMEEIAATQGDAGLTPELFRGVARIYADLAERAVADAPEHVPDDIALDDGPAPSQRGRHNRRRRGSAVTTGSCAACPPRAATAVPIRLSCVSRVVAVAQLVEPRVVVPVVAGSSPVRHPGPVAQWIERQASNLRAEVRLLPGPYGTGSQAATGVVTGPTASSRIGP